jgi:hypothetical protein
MNYIIDTEIKEIIIGLVKSLPNDQELGKRFRTEQRFHGISLEFPNDMELGRELRKINNFIKIK